MTARGSGAALLRPWIVAPATAPGWSADVAGPQRYIDVHPDGTEADSKG